jgi:hypothetical protein
MANRPRATRRTSTPQEHAQMARSDADSLAHPGVPEPRGASIWHSRRADMCVPGNRLLRRSGATFCVLFEHDHCHAPQGLRATSRPGYRTSRSSEHEGDAVAVADAWAWTICPSESESAPQAVGPTEIRVVFGVQLAIRVGPAGSSLYRWRRFRVNSIRAVRDARYSGVRFRRSRVHELSGGRRRVVVVPGRGRQPRRV